MEPIPVDGVRRIVHSHVVVEIQRGRVRISPRAQLPLLPAILRGEAEQPRSPGH